MIKRADKVYVSIQVFLFVMYLIPVIQLNIIIGSVTRLLGLAGSFLGILIVAFALIQLNKYLTPFPSPKKNSKLLRTGLYKYIRHPIYAGIILCSTGYGLFSESLWKLVVSGLLYLLFYLKSRYEENLLKDHFLEYKNYQKVTGRFFPFI